MTDLETSMATIIAVFQKYAEREGDKHKLKKSELKDLLHDELPDLMGVDAIMTATPDPMMTTLPETSHSFTEDVSTIVPATVPDGGDFAALIGGIVGAILLLLICTIAVLLWCLSRHKGSYVTNEMDEDDDIDDNDDESVGSDTALQSRIPLKAKDEE
ncbi:hypothetical protein GBF38_009022 [Nibea albiflora]|uniref:Uncharacterized protein n=1 Tax=Nibea albiflora TaxID=240163 RepID=A0ACB7ER28_NIBAL|nr:hypothetical protein GBF38_009022 [Nibea albiflora]